MTPNECQAARFLNAAGHSQESIAEFLDVQRLTVMRHVTDDCSCPDLEEPRIVPPVGGDELRAARKAAGLTQIELGEIVDTSNGLAVSVPKGPYVVGSAADELLLSGMWVSVLGARRYRL